MPRRRSRTLETRMLHGGSLVLERRPGYLFIWYARAHASEEEFDAQHASIDAALVEWGLDRAMFDLRDVEDPPAHVAPRVWAWLSSHPRLRRVASVVHAKALAEHHNLKAITDGVPIRAFHQTAAAERWLTILT